MRNVGRRWWFMLLLLGLILGIAVVLCEGLILLLHGATEAEAANRVASGVPDTSNCTGMQQKPSFGAAVVVDTNEVICSDLTSFGGTAVVNGEVNGDIVVFGGKVVIAGVVNGDIYLYGGDLTLQNGAQVNGDMHLCNSQWVKATTAQLHGDVYGCSQSVSQLVMDSGGGFNRFWLLITWIGAGLLLTSLLPEHVMLVRTTAMSKKRRSFVLGLLSMLLAPAVLAVLVALIIALPLAILVVVGLIAAWVLGTVAVGWQLGEYLVQRLAPQHNTRLLQVVVGLTVLALLESLPGIGWLISIGVGILGLGAVFLSRFGTRLYSQPRQPLML
jgi:hypothetical protein